MDKIVCFVRGKPFGEDVVPGNLHFMEILISGNDIILSQEKFLSIFHFLEGSVNIAARNPKEEENKEDGTTDHTKDKVKFLVVPEGVEVLSGDLVSIIEAESLNNGLISIRTKGFSRPENILISAVIPPGEYGVVHVVFFLGHL